MDTATIIQTTKNLLAEHNLGHYRVKVSNQMTKTYGRCSYGYNPTITISGPLARVNDDARTLDTIRHEVAHAIAGPHAAHGPRWVEACGLTGATPRQYYSYEDTVPAARWAGHCGACGKLVTTRERLTAKANRYAHQASKCAVRASVVARTLVWTDTRAAAPAPRTPVLVAASAPAPATTADIKACAGSCGRTLPATKFPTVSGKPGVRGNECRECQKARRSNR